MTDCILRVLQRRTNSCSFLWCLVDFFMVLFGFLIILIVTLVLVVFQATFITVTMLIVVLFPIVREYRDGYEYEE